MITHSTSRPENPGHSDLWVAGAGTFCGAWIALQRPSGGHDCPALGAATWHILTAATAAEAAATAATMQRHAAGVLAWWVRRNDPCGCVAELLHARTEG